MFEVTGLRGFLGGSGAMMDWASTVRKLSGGAKRRWDKAIPEILPNQPLSGRQLGDDPKKPQNPLVYD